MTLSKKVKEAIKPWHLLEHPFYKDWMSGELKKETLREYAAQYYKHVDVFPRYISATHSKCDDFKARKVLLENLNDEEGINAKPHPELWMQFAKAFNLSESEVLGRTACESISGVINTFMKNANSSFEEGLASFYSYESQVPEIAETKIKGLIEHYGLSDEDSLEFFRVHQEADVYHREACEVLLDKVEEKHHQSAVKAAVSSAKSLWDFLSEMHAFDNKQIMAIA